VALSPLFIFRIEISCGAFAGKRTDKPITLTPQNFIVDLHKKSGFSVFPFCIIFCIDFSIK
jgi:hypothetical protein